MRSVALAALLLCLASASADASSLKSRCFGAASRDPQRAFCAPFASSLRVSPSLKFAAKQFVARGVDRNAYLCRGGLRDRDRLVACYLGVARSTATSSAAMIGDSHAAQWRPGIDLFAKRKNLSVVSFVEHSCDYTLPDRLRSTGNFASCRRWRIRVARFLKLHPEIETVFVTGNSSYAGSRQNSAAEIAAYQSAWHKLPASVKRVVVIRDNPHSRPDNERCLTRAIKAKRNAARACSYSRSEAVGPDNAVLAARALNDPAINVVDLSDFYCDPKLCFPVIGQALVYADGSHVTPTFNRSLGPYLLRAVNALG